MVKNKNNNLSEEDNKLWETVSDKAIKYKKTNRVILKDKAEIKTQPLKEEMQSVSSIKRATGLIDFQSHNSARPTSLTACIAT